MDSELKNFSWKTSSTTFSTTTKKFEQYQDGNLFVWVDRANVSYIIQRHRTQFVIVMTDSKDTIEVQSDIASIDEFWGMAKMTTEEPVDSQGSGPSDLPTGYTF